MGTMWVDAKDFSIVQIEGVATKSPSMFAGATHMMRQYANIDGFSMATHARAESDSSSSAEPSSPSTTAITNYS